jgi:hypothetical protein
MTQYEVADALDDANKFCATIARGKFRNEASGLTEAVFDMRGFVPFKDEDTATVTFLSFNGNCYAVTALHVVRAFEKMARRDGIEFEGYCVPKEPGGIFSGPFLEVPSRLGGQQVDIAIRKMPAEWITRFGKRPYLIRSDNDPRKSPEFAIAAGFPTGEKADSKKLARLRMTGVIAVAEGVGSNLSADQMLFYSELPEAPGVKSLSGMGGGPVFWSEGEAHGLLGFVKEAGATTAGDPDGLFPNANSHFVVERATYDNLREWLSFVDENWDQERKRLNAKLEGSERR